MPGGGHIIINALINSPDISADERKKLDLMLPQLSFSDKLMIIRIVWRLLT